MHYLFLASLLWGTSFIAGKYAESLASPQLVVLIRLVIATLFVAHIAIPTIKKLDKNLLYRVILVSFLTFPVTFLLQFTGLKYTTATNAVTMMGFEPLIVLIAGYLFFKQKISRNQILLSVMAFVGVVMVMGKPNLSDDNFMGCLIVLSSCFSVAIWLQLSKKLMAEVPKDTYTALTLFFGALLTLPCVALLTDSWSITPTVEGVSAILYLGIGCSFIASWAWNKGVAMHSAAVSGFFLALEPVFGVLFGILLLGDRPSIYGAVGIGLVLFSIVYSLKLSKQD